MAQLCLLLFFQTPSTSWNPKGLSRPVMGLHYLYIHNGMNSVKSNASTHTLSGIRSCDPYVLAVQ
jgi:hypothetical protein